MKKIIAFLVLVLCMCNVSSAQKKPYKYGVVGQVGLLNGDGGEAPMLQIINGVSRDKWFAGIGVGIDYYNNRSVPVFLDLRRDFTSGKNVPFVYVDGGLNLPWLKNNEKNMWGWKTDYHSGGYYDVGVGWKLKGKSNRGFLASVGYNYKQLKETATVDQWSPLIWRSTEATEYYNNTFKRIVIKIGWQF